MPPVAATSQMSPPEAKAMRLPSGDRLGSAKAALAATACAAAGSDASVVDASNVAVASARPRKIIEACLKIIGICLSLFPSNKA
ncbi:hypothetical protein D9M73_103000 [compost metagenome]